MTHSWKFIFLLAFTAFVFSSCEKVTGEGPVVTEDRVYSDFKSVSVNLPGKVTHTIGNGFSVILRAQQNILDIIQTRVEGEELIMKLREGKRVRSHEEIEIELISPILNSASLAGSAEMHLRGENTSPQLALYIGGSGDISVEKVNLSGELRAHISGSGNITVSDGSIHSSWLKVSGSGNINTDAVTGISSYAEIAGSGNIRVNVSDALEARIEGSGSVLYRGSPHITSRVSGSGSIRPL